MSLAVGCSVGGIGWVSADLVPDGLWERVARPGHPPATARDTDAAETEA
jgi:hypothetical protein